MGIPIQHFVELNFDSFINVVNALGGIKMYFPEPVYDAYSGLNVQTTGCIALNGTQALQVVRARHLQYKGSGVTTTNPAYWPAENESDLARIRRDHEFLRVLASAVKAKGLSDPITDQQLVAGVVGQLTVDRSFSASDMLGLVLGYHGVDVNSAPQLTVPVSVDQFGNYVYKGGSYGDIEFPAEPQDRTTIDQIPRAQGRSRHVLGEPTAVTGRDHRLGAQWLGGLQPGHGHRQEPASPGVPIGPIGDSTPVGRESETVVVLRRQDARRSRRRPAGGQLLHGLGDHGRRPG